MDVVVWNKYRSMLQWTSSALTGNTTHNGRARNLGRLMRENGKQRSGMDGE